MRRGARLLVGLLVAVSPLAWALPASASGPEAIDSYEVLATLESDGVLSVVETITYDFGDNDRHGIYRTIPVRYPYDDTYERVLKVGNVQVRSDAPDDVETSNEGNAFVIRIGDPDRTVTGSHTYRIFYTVRGAVNEFPDHIEVSWNAIGAEWSVPIADARVLVTMPGEITGTTCFAGSVYSELPCDSTKTVGSTATFGQAVLEPEQAFTVVVGAPLGSVQPGAAAPILDETFSVSRAFSLTPATIVGSLALLLAGLAGVGALVWGRGRDRRWPGMTPGLDPPPGVATDEIRPLFSSPEGAVEFRPPRDLRPAQVGLLLDERADTLDVSATVVDLAVRGYLRIEELPRAHWFASRDWRLTRLREVDDSLLPYEGMLLRDLFATGPDVLLSSLKKTFAAELAAVRKAIETDAVTRGFFKSRPETTRAIWGGLGLVAVVAGIGLTWLLAATSHVALLGLAVIVVGAVLLFSAGRMPARTAKGSAAYAQVLGFRRYVETAEVEQLRYEESVDVFSRYLPYAMVFGETERWAKALAALGAAAATAGVVSSPIPWYSGPDGWDLDSLGDSLGSFAESSGSTFAASAASSGGSAGSSGGGFGGGGGGSW